MILIRHEEEPSSATSIPDYSSLVRAPTVGEADRWRWSWAGPEEDLTLEDDDGDEDTDEDVGGGGGGGGREGRAGP